MAIAAERDARREAMAARKIERADRERRNVAAGNPGDIDFISLVRDWRVSGIVKKEEHEDRGGPSKICICVRKRPISNKEKAKKDHDSITCANPTVHVHSAKLKVDGITKYLDNNSFRFDHSFDEGEVRWSEERRDKLAATILTRRIAKTWTSAQCAPPSPISEIIRAIILTLFAIRFAHRSLHRTFTSTPRCHLLTLSAPGREGVRHASRTDRRGRGRLIRWEEYRSWLLRTFSCSWRRVEAARRTTR